MRLCDVDRCFFALCGANLVTVFTIADLSVEERGALLYLDTAADLTDLSFPLDARSVFARPARAAQSVDNFTR